MTSVLPQGRLAGQTAMHYRVLGPDSAGVSAAELRRLFRGQRLPAARKARLSQGPRLLLVSGTRVVGIAAYDRTDREIRVYELGVDTGAACGVDEIANGLLDALELASMAGGAQRLVILPRTVLNPALTRRRGYVTVGEGSPSVWVQKNFA